MRSLLAVLLASVVALPATHAQAPTDSALVRRIKSDVVDSLALNPKLNLRSKRAMARIVARGDSITRNAVDTVRRTDTVYVTKPDSTPSDTTVIVVKPPVDTTVVVVPPPPPPDSVALVTGPATRAELPRIAATSALPTIGRAVKVCAICNLQTAIDNAVSGDQLLLAPGTTYTGNFTLPNKGSGQGWIVIRTDTSITTPGRMTPSTASRLKLARIVSPTNDPAIGTAAGAHHWALDAIEVANAAGVTDVSAIVVFGSGDVAVQKLVADAPHDLILSRSYVHGTATRNVHRCIALNSGAAAVVDSWVSECHSNNNDSQAIIGWNGPGPFEIRNNHLEAGHEPIMFGGANPAIDALSPADITIRGNWIGHPLAWKGVWQVKTLLELKNARRTLVEGNVLENVWVDGQVGFALLLKSTNQGCALPMAQTADVTVRYNRIVNAANGINIAGHASECGASGVYERAAARITVSDNVIGPFGYPNGSNGIPLQILSGAEDVAFVHNTATTAGISAIAFDGPAAVRAAIHSSVFPHGQYGIKGTGTQDGGNTFTTYMPGGLFAANVVIGGDVYPASCALYPATTLCPATLPATLPLGYDGRAVGADTAKVNAMTRDAVVAP